MPPFKIEERSPDPKIYSKQIVNLVTQRRQLSQDDSISLRRRLPKWYEQYRGFRKHRAQPFRNQVHVPLTFATIESDVAVKASLIAGQRPYVEFMPSGPEDSPGSRRTTSLVDQQFVNARFYPKLLDLLRAADIGGTSVVQWFWRKDINTRQQRVPVPDPQTGQVVPQVILGEFTDFDGPDFEVIDLLDFYPEPGKVKMAEMRWVIRRYFLDFDEIVRMAQPGPDGEPPVFDPEAVEELRDFPINDASSQQLEERRIQPGALFTAQNKPDRFDKFSKPVEMVEMHGVFPDELVPDDNFNNRLVTIANESVQLRNVSNPIWAEGFSFASYSPIPDPFSFYGIGKVEPSERLQATASRITSQKLDALDILVDPHFIYNRQANVDTRKLYSRAGGLTPADGPPAEAVQALVPDMRGVDKAIIEVENLWRWMQISSGVLEDTVIGLGGGSDRQTAREFLGRAESSQRRLVFETLMCVDQFVEPLAQAFRELNAQFMDFPTKVRMIGQNAIIDPETGAPIQDDPFATLQDVILKYDMKAQATTSLVGKGAKQQNDILMVQTAAATPIGIITNWVNAARKLYGDFDWPVDDLILPVNEQQMAVALAAQAMVQQASAQKAGENTQTSGSGGGTTKSAPSGLNKDILSQFISPQQPTSGANGGLTGTL